MGKEIRIPHHLIKDPQKITPVIARAISEAMEERKAIHRYEVDSMEDDFEKGERIIRMQSKKISVGFGKAG